MDLVLTPPYLKEEKFKKPVGLIGMFVRVTCLTNEQNFWTLGGPHLRSAY